MEKLTKREACEHVAGATATEFAEITLDSGNTYSQCFDCYLKVITDQGKNKQEADSDAEPVEVMGYHVYRSADPDLPKSEWTRLTPEPIPQNGFKDRPPVRGLTYYYYVTAVSVHGVESQPSAVASAVALSTDVEQ